MPSTDQVDNELNEEQLKNLDVLIDSIHDKNCILLLGPDASVAENDEKSMSEILSNQLANEIKDELPPKEYLKINQDNLAQTSLFHSIAKGGDSFLKTTVKNFYEARKDITSDFHKNLAELPFELIITSTLDRMFFNALFKIGKTPHYLDKIQDVPQPYYYNFKRASKLGIFAEDISVSSPLLYNLYGCCNKTESLVLTENELIDFLIAVIKREPPLPDAILRELRSPSKSLLFVGFGFQNWYLRILLKALEEQEKHSSSFAWEKISQPQEEDFDRTILFFKKSKYRIHIFMTELDLFAQELKERYFCKYPNNDLGAPIEVVLPANAPTAFVSHASQNKEDATWLCDQLKSRGVKPWIDKKDIPGGSDWESEIKKAIKNKEQINYFIIIQSKELNKKTEGVVFREINTALERQIDIRKGFTFIIPVKIDDSDLLEELQGIQAIDLSDRNKIGELIRTIKRDVQKRKKQR